MFYKKKKKLFKKINTLLAIKEIDTGEASPASASLTATMKSPIPSLRDLGSNSYIIRRFLFFLLLSSLLLLLA